jgi:hypothetical protein
MAGKLLIINPQQYMEVPFDQQVTIGRDVYNTLSLQDGEISRSHAIIFDQGDEPIIKDLNSRNGVYVNGDRVTEQALLPGDEIIVGSSIIFFNPPDKMDIERALSRRGEHIFARRAENAPARNDHPMTVFTCEQMEKSIHDLFHSQDETNFFSLPNAMSLLQAFMDMDRAPDTADLFQMTLKRALGFLGGKRGVIMETDSAKEKLKVRALRPRAAVGSGNRNLPAGAPRRAPRRTLRLLSGCRRGQSLREDGRTHAQPRAFVPRRADHHRGNLLRLHLSGKRRRKLRIRLRRPALAFLRRLAPGGTAAPRRRTSATSRPRPSSPKASADRPRASATSRIHPCR